MLVTQREVGAVEPDAAALLGGYFRRYAVTRPPIGVFNLWDIAIMIGGIVLVPYLYLLLPIWLVASLLALAILSVLYCHVGADPAGALGDLAGDAGPAGG